MRSGLISDAPATVPVLPPISVPMFPPITVLFKSVNFCPKRAWFPVSPYAPRSFTSVPSPSRFGKRYDADAFGYRK